MGGILRSFKVIMFNSVDVTCFFIARFMIYYLKISGGDYVITDFHLKKRASCIDQTKNKNPSS